MTAVEVVELVLASDLLVEDLTLVPEQGASERDIEAEQRAIGLELSVGFQRFLRRWNGANLEVLTLFGCRVTPSEIARLRDRQDLRPVGMNDAVIIGSDPAGFVFAEAADGQVYSIDSDGGAVKVIAASFDDFIGRLVFGADAALFAGDEWKQELQDVGLLA